MKNYCQIVIDSEFGNHKFLSLRVCTLNQHCYIVTLYRVTNYVVMSKGGYMYTNKERKVT